MELQLLRRCSKSIAHLLCCRSSTPMVSIRGLFHSNWSMLEASTESMVM